MLAEAPQFMGKATWEVTKEAWRGFRGGISVLSKISEAASLINYQRNTYAQAMRERRLVSPLTVRYWRGFLNR